MKSDIPFGRAIVKLRRIADMDLKTLKGKGRLEKLEAGC
jgi:hypothetical protein